MTEEQLKEDGASWDAYLSAPPRTQGEMETLVAAIGGWIKRIREEIKPELPARMVPALEEHLKALELAVKTIKGASILTDYALLAVSDYLGPRREETE